MEEAIDIYFEIFNAKLTFSNIMAIYILNKYTKESSEKRKKIKPRQLPQHHFSKTEGKRNPQDESKLIKMRTIKVSTQEHTHRLTD